MCIVLVGFGLVCAVLWRSECRVLSCTEFLVAYCGVLQCIALYCIVLNSILLHCIELY